MLSCPRCRGVVRLLTIAAVSDVLSLLQPDEGGILNGGLVKAVAHPSSQSWRTGTANRPSPKSTVAVPS